MSDALIAHVDSPGPAAYSPKLPDSKVGFSIAGRHRDKDTVVSPGPAAYQVRATIGDAPKYSLKGRDAKDGTEAVV
jgi:hypothetical protein